MSVDGRDLEKVDSFVFFGSLMPKSSEDMKKRIVLAATAFGNMKKNIWSRKDIGRKLKLRLFYALFLTIAICAAQTLALTQKNTRVLQIFENHCRRSILNIKLLDRISNN